MTKLFKIAFLSGVLFLVSMDARATSVGTQTDHCPFCHHDYMVSVLLSYNNFSGDDRPPVMPPSSCPFCLAVWTGKPPKELTKQQREALDAALENWPHDLSTSERQNLLRELDEKYSDVRERISSALQTRCAAALKGAKLPRFVVKPTRLQRKRRDWNQNDHAKFLKELPRLIQAQKEGREAVIKPESRMASEDIVTLQQAEREIVNGNTLGFEYFVRWTVTVGDGTVLDGGQTVGSVFGDILFDVARCKKLPWPKDVDISKAHSSFAADCLRYAYEPARQLDRPLKNAITNSTGLYAKAAELRPSPFERAQIVLKAAAGKKDRAATRLIPSLAPSQLDTYGDAFTLYYQRIGKPEDLRLLEICAAYAMNKFKSAERRGRHEGWRYHDPLAAYEITRLKCQLMGEPVSFASAK